MRGREQHVPEHRQGWGHEHETNKQANKSRPGPTQNHAHPPHEGMFGAHCNIKRFYRIVTNNGPTKGDRIYHTSY